MAKNLRWENSFQSFGMLAKVLAISQFTSYIYLLYVKFYILYGRWGVSRRKNWRFFLAGPANNIFRRYCTFVPPLLLLMTLMKKRGWKLYRSPNPNPRGYESAIAPKDTHFICKMLFLKKNGLQLSCRLKNYMPEICLNEVRHWS